MTTNERHITTHRPRLAAALLACALLALSLAACGSSSSNDNSSSSQAAAPPPATEATTTTTAPAAAGGQTIPLAALPGALKFDKTALTAKAGSVTVSMTNPAGNSIPHAIAVEGNGVDKDGKTVQGGGTSTVTLKLKAGTYSFYCPVPGHKAAGMKGTLTVS